MRFAVRSQTVTSVEIEAVMYVFNCLLTIYATEVVDSTTAGDCCIHEAQVGFFGIFKIRKGAIFFLAPSDTRKTF